MADGSHMDDSAAQGHRAIRMAVEARFEQIAQDKAAARKAFDRREQAARFILDGLDAGADAAAWLAVAPEIARRLTERERVGLLIGVIKSLPDDITSQVLDGLFEPGTFSCTSQDHVWEANWWADHATPAEIKAFVHAGIKRMPAKTRTGMLDWLKGYQA
jgi:hypothetical protein